MHMRSLMVTVLFALGATAAAAQDRVRLEVYSTLEVENLKDFKTAFEAENRDIEILWNRDSTGVVTARILAEQGAQRGDAIWGLAVTSMLLLDKRGLLEPYAPKNLANIKPAFRDPANPPAWVGMEALGRRGVLQHGGGSQARPGQARLVVRSHRPALQGQAHHAAPGLVGDGLLPCLCLDPDVRRGQGLGVHGQAARQHRRLRTLRHAALPACRRRRVPARHLLRAGGRQRPPEGRADRRPGDEGGRRLGHGRCRHPARHQEARGGAPADGLRFQPQGQRALRLVREPGRDAGHREPYPRLSRRASPNR